MTLGKHDKALTFLNFENGANLGADASGFSRNGVASAVTQVASLDGKTNVASFVPANDSGIDLTTLLPSISASTSVSVSAWIRLNSVGTGVRCIWSASDNTVASREIIFFTEAAKLKAQVRNNTTATWVIISTADLVINTWYHVAMTSGVGGAQIWINGVSQGTNASTVTIADIVTNRMQIGYNVDNASGGAGREFEFDGYMKDIIVSGTAINAATVSDIYTNDIYSYFVIPQKFQSNMIGRDSIVPGIDDDYSIVAGKVFQWGYNANARLAATNPLDHVNESAGDMGSWLAMCNELVPLLAYKQAIMLVPAAQGGTGFITNNWNPGDALYEAALSRDISALNSHTLSSIGAITLIGGETDADNGNTNFQADVQAMYDDLVNRLPGFSSSIPFIAAEIKGSTIPANVAVINAAWAAFVAAGSGRYLIETGDLTLFDQFHFNAASTRTIGERMAAVLTGEDPVVPSNPVAAMVRSQVKSIIGAMVR